jgi:hypothetical protein
VLGRILESVYMVKSPIYTYPRVPVTDEKAAMISF